MLYVKPITWRAWNVIRLLVTQTTFLGSLILLSYRYRNKKNKKTKKPELQTTFPLPFLSPVFATFCIKTSARVTCFLRKGNECSFKYVFFYSKSKMTLSMGSKWVPCILHYFLGLTARFPLFSIFRHSLNLPHTQLYLYPTSSNFCLYRDININHF